MGQPDNSTSQAQAIGLKESKSISTEIESMKSTNVYLDTAYAIALSSSTDAHHDRAIELAEQLESNRVKLTTARPVVLEIGNALARPR